ncbi:MAG: DMT family transporter [Fimbriimonadaceae bacterium]|nr:DMT family transporter [Fimbriimonadaceae bacterium]
MPYAVLTAALFAVSMLFATRSTRNVGVGRATLLRILLATTVLGLWAAAAGRGLPRAAVAWLLLSGLIGMGLGDVAAFAAIPRIGGRLSAVIGQCLCAPFALASEALWLGTRVTGLELLTVLLILGGLALSLEPDRHREPRREVTAGAFRGGLLLAVLGSLSTAVGAVGSRLALDCLPAGATWHPATAAFWRMVAGTGVTLLFYAPLLRHWVQAARAGRAQPALPRYGATIANAFCGSIFGMAAMQQALATTPAGVVLAVTATAPIGTMLLLWLLEGSRPTARAALGGFVAVGGVVVLQTVRG